MSHDRVRPDPAPRIPALLRAPGRAFSGRGLRRLAAVLSAVTIGALTLGSLALTSPTPRSPALTASPARARAASVVLCSGYQGCDQRGYPSYGYGQHRRTSYWQMYSGDECTNYVAYVEHAYFRVATPGYRLGNADQWPAAAAAHGVTVNTEPSVGAVAVWAGHAYGIGPDGHVAVVEQVGPHDGYIVVSQQHLLAETNGYDWARLNAGFPARTWQPWPSYFIHFPLGRGMAHRPTGGGGHAGPHRRAAQARPRRRHR
jgi:surface antigen